MISLSATADLLASVLFNHLVGELRWFDSRCCANLGSATGTAGIPVCGRWAEAPTLTLLGPVPPLRFSLHNRHNDTARMLRSHYCCR
jgi:hypothetical protein